MSTWLDAVITALGWALVHSTWQLSLLALVLWGLLRALDGASPTTRYGLSVGALLLSVAVFSATAWFFFDPVLAQAGVLAALGASPDPQAGWQPTDAFPVLVGAWGLGMVACSIRFVGGLIHIHHLKTHHNTPVSQPLQIRITALAAHLGLSRPIPTVISELVEVPMVVGALRPVILLPGVALTGLSSTELTCILLHELAHIRRLDLWVNLLQGMVEILLFFHPAVWWISRRIRAERELCCDDVVVANADPVRYARALALLEEHRTGHTRLTAAATDGALRHRIQRLLAAPTPPRRSSRGLLVVVVLSLLGLLSARQSTADERDLNALLDEFLAMEIAYDADSHTHQEQYNDIATDLLDLDDVLNEIEEEAAGLAASDPERYGGLASLRLAQARTHAADAIFYATVPDLSAPAERDLQDNARAQAIGHLARARDDYQHAIRTLGAAPGQLGLVVEAQHGLAHLEPDLMYIQDGLEASIIDRRHLPIFEQGMVHLAAGEAEAASHAFERLSESSSWVLRTMGLYGSTLAGQLRQAQPDISNMIIVQLRTQRQEDDLERIKRQTEDDAGLKLLVATQLMAAGDFEQAAVWLEEAQRLNDPALADAIRFNLDRCRATTTPFEGDLPARLISYDRLLRKQVRAGRR